MARFEVLHEEGVRSVHITLADEAIRAEAGALCTLEGEVRIEAPLPGPRAYLRAVLSDEAVFRPRYFGTGAVTLESSLGGFHLLELAAGEEWILDKGSYWASEESVELGVHREPTWTSFWAGQGFVDYRTRVRGPGKVVLASSGPVQEVVLEKDRYWAQGPYVIARTPGLDYTLQRPTRSFLRSFTTRERLIRSYQGTGRLLVSSTPYWRKLVAERRLLDAAPGDVA
jgi:uncharacterized protein (AIM24 family)